MEKVTSQVRRYFCDCLQSHILSLVSRKDDSTSAAITMIAHFPCRTGSLDALGDEQLTG